MSAPLKNMKEKDDVFLIAEVAQAHDGSLGILHSYIDSISSTGVNAIKFQMHIASAESSSVEPFRVNFSYEDVTRFDYWKRMEFTFDQWRDIKKHCDDVGLNFICTPFSNKAIDWLEDLDIEIYKVGSGDVNNFLMLERLLQTKKEIIISSGMSSLEELDESIDYLNGAKDRLSLLQCTSSYPTGASTLGLNLISEFSKRYNIPVGLSDHSGKIYSSIAAASLGAKIIEFHAVFDRRMFGPDASSSLLVDEIKDLAIDLKKRGKKIVFTNR